MHLSSLQQSPSPVLNMKDQKRLYYNGCGVEGGEVNRTFSEGFQETETFVSYETTFPERGPNRREQWEIESGEKEVLPIRRGEYWRGPLTGWGTACHKIVKQSCIFWESFTRTSCQPFLYWWAFSYFHFFLSPAQIPQKITSAALLLLSSTLPSCCPSMTSLWLNPGKSYLSFPARVLHVLTTVGENRDQVFTWWTFKDAYLLLCLDIHRSFVKPSKSLNPCPAPPASLYTLSIKALILLEIWMSLDGNISALSSSPQAEPHFTHPLPLSSSHLERESSGLHDFRSVSFLFSDLPLQLLLLMDPSHQQNQEICLPP